EAVLSQSALKSIDKGKKRRHINAIDSFLIALLIIGCIIALVKQQQSLAINVQQADVEPLFRFKKCNIFTIEDYDIYSKEKTIELALNEIEKEKINCNNTSYDLYFAKMLLNKENSLFSFLGICLTNEKSKQTYCKTRADNNGKENN
ncbi:hypothetical protein, partial [Serratia liquefaciens]|uniref:hypothetical protein n=1 Tax=Serratia liquefaciens TaxID=614 RepID=UPI0037F60F55